MVILFHHRMPLDQCQAQWAGSPRKVGGIRVYHLDLDNIVETTHSHHQEEGDTVHLEGEEDIHHEAGAMARGVDMEDRKAHKTWAGEADTVREVAILIAGEEALQWMVLPQLEQAWLLEW
jgi:hypothetical protein